MSRCFNVRCSNVRCFNVSCVGIPSICIHTRVGAVKHEGGSGHNRGNLIGSRHVFPLPSPQAPQQPQHHPLHGLPAWISPQLEGMGMKAGSEGRSVGALAGVASNQHNNHERQGREGPLLSPSDQAREGINSGMGSGAGGGRGHGGLVALIKGRDESGVRKAPQIQQQQQQQQQQRQEQQLQQHHPQLQQGRDGGGGLGNGHDDSSADMKADHGIAGMLTAQQLGLQRISTQRLPYGSGGGGLVAAGLAPANSAPLPPQHQVKLGGWSFLVQGLQKARFLSTNKAPIS